MVLNTQYVRVGVLELFCVREWAIKMKLCDLMGEELSTGEELKTFREIYVMVSQVIEVMHHLAMKFMSPNIAAKYGSNGFV